ncbi:MAG: hemolysin family protein [Anaerolineae bacterium]
MPAAPLQALALSAPVVAVAVPLLIIAFLIGMNALFVAAEFAIVAVPRTRMEQLAEGGSAEAQRVVTVLRDPDEQNRYLATAQIGITIVSLALGMYGEHTVADWLLGPLEGLGTLAAPAAHTLATLLATALLTYLHVVLGEMVPKSLGIQTAEATAIRLSLPMAMLQRVLRPIIWALNGIANWVTRLLGVPPADAHSRLMSSDELEIIVGESAARGYIAKDEHLFIENIFDFGERTAGQVMTPRPRVVGLPATDDEADVLKQVCETRFSRYPVYGDDLDEIVGMLHVKDLARHRLRADADFDLRRLARAAHFVPESLPLEDLLAQFREEQRSVAVVLDEYGGAAGIVTLEDIVEEVVGEILDEFDQEIAPIAEIAPGVLRVRGDTLLDELEQHYDLDLEHPEAETVGGLVMAELGRIAEPGDRVSYGGVEFAVETVEGLAVQTVIARLPEADAGAATGTKAPTRPDQPTPPGEER